MVVVGGDAAFYPACVIVIIERHHVSLYIALLCCRIMVLNLLNLYTLIFALFGKISLMVRNVHIFYFHRPTYSNIISIVRPTRCTNVSNLFYFGIAQYMF